MLYSRARSERNQSSSGTATESGTGTTAGAGSGVSSRIASTTNAGATGGTAPVTGTAATAGSVTSGTVGGGASVTLSSEREAFGRWRDRQYFGPRRWFQTGREENWDKDTGECWTFNLSGISSERYPNCLSLIL